MSVGKIRCLSKKIGSYRQNSVILSGKFGHFVQAASGRKLRSTGPSGQDGGAGSGGGGTESGVGFRETKELGGGLPKQDTAVQKEERRNMSE